MAVPSRRRIPEATVARLPLYYRALLEVSDSDVGTVSSERLAELAGVNAALIPLSADGTPALARVLGDVLRRPRQIAALFGLARETRRALSALTGPARALRQAFAAA